MSDFPAKYLKVLGDFPEKADAMSEAELKKALVEAERAILQTRKDKEADAKLTEAKEQVKELSSDYNEIIKENNAKIQYIVYALDSRGTP